MLCEPQRRCYGLVHPAGRKRRDVSSTKGKQKTQFRNKKKQAENRFRDTQWADSLFAATPCFTIPATGIFVGVMPQSKTQKHFAKAAGAKRRGSQVEALELVRVEDDWHCHCSTEGLGGTTLTSSRGDDANTIIKCLLRKFREIS